MGAQPKCHVWKPCWDGHGDQKGHILGPKGLGPKSSGSGMGDARQPPCFRAPNDVVRYTTMELLDITTQYTMNEEAVRAPHVPGGREAILGSSRAAPSNLVIQGTKKGGKKRQKLRPQWAAFLTGYNNDDNIPL
jgi:hypothetical protein